MDSERTAENALVPGARCATHQQRAATGVCGRCGDYLCGACSQRVGERLYCGECAPRLGSEHSSRSVQALVLGLLSVHLLFFLAPAAIALSWLELRQIGAGQAPAGGRWLSLAALALGVVSCLMALSGLLVWASLGAER